MVINQKFSFSLLEEIANLQFTHHTNESQITFFSAKAAYKKYKHKPEQNAILAGGKSPPLPLQKLC